MTKIKHRLFHKIGFIIILALISSCAKSSDTTSSSTDTETTIIISTTSDTIGVGQILPISATPAQPNSNKLTYTWQASTGNLTVTNNASVFWIAPQTPGIATLNLQVRSKNWTIEKNIAITVTSQNHTNTYPFLYDSSMTRINDSKPYLFSATTQVLNNAPVDFIIRKNSGLILKHRLSLENHIAFLLLNDIPIVSGGVSDPEGILTENPLIETPDTFIWPTGTTIRANTTFTSNQKFLAFNLEIIIIPHEEKTPVTQLSASALTIKTSFATMLGESPKRVIQTQP